MVCDSRYELTSKHPGRGRGRDAEREREREGKKGNMSREEEKVLEIREGREVRLQTIVARIKREDEEECGRVCEGKGLQPGGCDRTLGSCLQSSSLCASLC